MEDWAAKMRAWEEAGGADAPEDPGYWARGMKEYMEGKQEVIKEDPRKTPFKMGVQKNPADWTTHAKAAWVEDPQAKIKIYAEARGIPEQNYVITQDGIKYLDEETGLFIPEDMPMATAITTGITSRPLSTAGGIAGAAMGGPALAGLLAAGGRGIEKTIGYAMGDKPTTLDTLSDLTSEFVLGTLGEYAGRNIIHAIDMSRGKEAAKLLREAGRGRDRIMLSEVKEMRALGERFGIDLYTPQLTKSRELAGRWNLLADLTETADKIGDAGLKQYEQVAASVDNFINTFAPPTTSPMATGEKAVEAANKGIEAAKTIRKNKASILYDRAFQGGAIVDPSDALSEIDLLMGKTVSKDPSYGALKRVKGMIEEAGGDLEKLHRVKTRGIDAVLNKAKSDSTLRREMKLVKDKLVAGMDDASPDYADAREMFSKLSPEVQALEGSKIGEIAKLQNEAVEKTAYRVFSPNQSSPEIVANIKPVIIKYGGKETWDELLRVHLSNVLDAIKEPVSTSTNLGGRFRQALWGYPKQRKILEAAMSPKQFSNMKDFSVLLDRLGIIITKESRTTPIAHELQEMKDAAGKGIFMAPLRWAAHPTVSPARPFYEKLTDIRFKFRANMVADLMIDPKTAKQLDRLLVLKPRSMKFIEGMATLFTQIGGRIVYEQGRDIASEFIAGEEPEQMEMP